MDVKPTRGPLRYFESMPDPRAANVSFSLPSLMAIALLGVLCRCEDYDEIACWARERTTLLATFLDLPCDEQGPRTPHADTFERLLRRLDPVAFERAFIAFTQGLAEASQGRLIAIDGKSLRGSVDQGGRKAAIHMINAWDEHNHLVLGQLAVDEKSNEITAVPTLLAMLDVKGAVVTLDAMHCQKETAAAIRKAGGDYLLTVKDNQKQLHEDIALFFDDAIQQHDAHLRRAQAEPDSTHGRLDQRRIWTSGDVAWLRRHHPDWKDLKGLIRVECTRMDFKTGKETTTRRHYITSLDPAEVSAEQLLELARGHWSVENRLHWCLDVCFGEDDSRIRKDHGPRNFACLRRQAMNLLQKNPPPRGKHGSPSDKISLKRRRLLCSLNDDYLLNTLLQTA
jgi:predicted transposase YbfD/YdcC